MNWDIGSFFDWPGMAQKIRKHAATWIKMQEQAAEHNLLSPSNKTDSWTSVLCPACPISMILLALLLSAGNTDLNEDKNLEIGRDLKFPDLSCIRHDKWMASQSAAESKREISWCYQWAQERSGPWMRELILAPPYWAFSSPGTKLFMQQKFAHRIFSKLLNTQCKLSIALRKHGKFKRKGSILIFRISPLTLYNLIFLLCWCIHASHGFYDWV